MRYKIQFLPSERSIDVEAEGMTLLEATREAGLPIASACGENGTCARCGLLILEGGDNLDPETEREARIKERNRIDPEQRLACRVRPRGNLTVRATYW
jgi:ferredoxin